MTILGKLKKATQSLSYRVIQFYSSDSLYFCHNKVVFQIYRPQIL